MINITKSILPLCLAGLCVALSACGPAAVETGASLSPEDKAAKSGDEPVSPGGPVQISHRIVGTPLIGQPLSIDLNFKSMRGATPLKVEYQINDTSALSFADQQVRLTTAVPDSQSMIAEKQVTVIPQREGRLYLNVSVGVESDFGTASTVMAIPIQVGEGPRSFEENGVLDTDASGNVVRVLPATPRS